MHLTPSSSREARRDRTSELVRQIVLSRFLERPVEGVVRVVQDAEKIARRCRLLDGRSPIVRRVSSPGAEVGAVPSGACGVVQVKEGEPVLVFRALCADEYEIDSDRLAMWRAEVDRGTAVRALGAVRTLLLATARSRITRAAWKVLARAQRRYLTTCDEAALAPFTARELVRRIRAAGVALADPSRVSRTLRATSIVLPDGSTRSLRALCPSTRSVLAARIRKVLEQERRLRAAGRLAGAWGDAELARWVKKGDGVVVSRRIICYCRKRLGVPGARARARRGAYMWATAGFSALHPLERRSVLRRAPRAPGIYELRIAPGHPGYESICSGVSYIGRAQDLRVRLLTHASASARNEGLAHLVRNSRVLFRFRLESKKDLEPMEAGLYRRFLDTYGHPPRCNRVSP